jgi:hypothetical protein
MSSSKKMTCKGTLQQVFITVYRQQSKMSSSKKLTCKGTLRQVFIRVYRLGDTVSHAGILDPAVWTVAPSTFSLVHLPPSFPCQSTVCTDTVWLGVDGGCVGDNILQEFNTLSLNRFRTYKIARPPQKKPRSWMGLIRINTCRKVPVRSIFLDDDILLWCLYS